MSATEQVIDKVRALPEFQAEAVLAFIRELSESPAVSAADLMRMAPADRRRILANQARQADALYRRHREMIIEETEPPLAYG